VLEETKRADKVLVAHPNDISHLPPFSLSAPPSSQSPPQSTNKRQKEKSKGTTRKNSHFLTLLQSPVPSVVCVAPPFPLMAVAYNWCPLPPFPFTLGPGGVHGQASERIHQQPGEGEAGSGSRDQSVGGMRPATYGEGGICYPLPAGWFVCGWVARRVVTGQVRSTA